MQNGFSTNTGMLCFSSHMVVSQCSDAELQIIATVFLFKKESGLSFVNYDVEIIEGEDIDLTKSDVIVTAVATKLATRKIITKLSELKAMNIILPLSTI